MIASTALENSNISLENYDVLQNSTSENVLPMEISLNTDGIQENSMFVQNYIIRHLDDGNLEMVFCNTETVQNDNENVGKDEGKSVEVHVIQENLTNSKPLGPIKIEKPIINPTVYSCFKCKEQFNNLALFRKHLKWHKSEKKFNCSKCSAGFNIENNLKVHVTIHHPGPASVCPICKIKFQRKASLKSHMIVHQVEEVFVCDECHAEFQNDDELLKHMEIHAVTKVCKNESDSLVCPYCKLDFTTPSEYKQHVARHLEVKRNVLKGKRSRKRRVRDWASVHKCKYCGKLFPKVCLLERHERIHTGEKPYVCEVCNKSFAQNGTLHIHLGSHTGYKPYSCTLCPAKFTQKGNLRAHIDKTHTAPKGNQKMYKCTQCACIFKKIATLNGHVTKIHLNKGQDNVCETENVMDQVMDGLKMMNNAMNKSFTKKNVPGASWVRLAESEANGGVRRYLVRQKKVGDIRWYFCDYCSSRFKKPSDLIRHIRTHTLEKPYKCTKCNMAFSLKSTLTNHHKTHSNQGCDCSFCDNSSKHQRRLDEHIKEHEKNKAANCTCVLCDKVCPLRKGKQQKSMLQTNIQSTQNVKEPFCQKPNDTLRERLDLEESLSPKETKSKFPDVEAEKSLLKRPHHCKICNVRFARFNSLKKHNLYHTGERKYSCSLCSKAFITKYRLTEHLNYHKNIRNHACQICAKKFVTASLLKRHMLVHNTFKPYLCPYCNKTFKTFLMTRTHIRNVHKLNVTQSDVVVDEATPEKNTENQICTVATSDEPVSNPVVLTVAPSENQLELNQDYQMVYLNISDVQLVNNEAAISDSALSTLKLPNESLLFNDTQDGSVLFNVEPVKAPTMVDPNVVIKTDFAKEKPATNMGEVEVFSAVNLSDMPINIIQPEEEKAGMDIFNAQVLCINCHKMFSGMVVFQGHTCSTSTTNPVTNVQVVETPEDNKETTESKLDSPKQSKCRFCPYVTVSDEKFRRHLSFSHADTLDKMCRYCYKDFKKPSDLTRHIRTHTGERPFECSQCKKKFSLKSTLESHKRTHESGGQKNVSCDVCNANFTTKSSLKVHMLLHTGARPHACNFCEQTFRTSAIRRAHEKNIHLNGARRPNSPKGIKLLRTVAEEVVDNLRQQDSIASTEPTVLTSPDPMSLDFLQHIQTSGIVVSEGAIPFSLNDITLLGYGEEEQSTELTSMEDNGGVVDQVQSKPPKVECDICHKMYASKDVLRKHKKNVHGQNKKFPCIKCDKGYDDLEELNKHIVKIHTGYRPYSCQYCSNSFGEENSLKTHIKRIHQKSLLTQETTNALLGLQFDLPSGSII